MSSAMETSPTAVKRVRLSREQRLNQLIDVAWSLVRDEGTDALTLPHLAEAAAVAKPVVYDHFGTRNGLLAALYQDFDARQTVVMDAAIAASDPTLQGTARTIAASYVECVLAQGREIPGVLAALAGSPELASVKRTYQLIYIEKCRKVLSPFTGEKRIAAAAFWAMLGAADGLSNAAATGDITAEEARDELCETILAMVERSVRPA
ncbi:TetR/AcrR family transcriptional regulator [Ensifer sp. NPDC090286]|uniref:TetR/AcrR family transcriptional regulator n=1 Tax=Ensifer sp. NPDC090286 TaxID=3363991 RepID=UPI00383B8A90